MFADGVLEQAIAEFKKTADTPAKKILVEFLETHIEEIKAYQPRMVTLDATLPTIRKRRPASNPNKQDPT